MATLTESPTYHAGIYQLETDDPVLGGSSGISNDQAKQLADRTAWLKQKIDAGGLGTGASNYAGNVNTLTTSGWYYLTTGSTNKPISGEGWINVVNAPTAGYVLQLFYHTSDRMFMRRIFDGPTYGSWIELAVVTSSVDTLVGMVAPFAMNSVPSGWLKCSGGQVSRSTYAALFAKISTTYGVGNGTTTFNLPDMRGEFMRGFDDGRGVDASRVFGSAQSDDFKTHHHSLQKVNTTPGSKTGYDLGAVNSSGSLGTLSTDNIQDFGGTETRPRNVAMLYCIKY